MPHYDYTCPICGKVEERFYSISAVPASIGCTGTIMSPLTSDTPVRCRGRMKRQISAGCGVIFKGTGFHVTDYTATGPKPQPAPAKEPT